MRYRVFCSDGDDYYEFYEDNKRKAELLFNMAVQSNFFSYVDLSETRETFLLKKEWSEDDEE